ncbi:hypothetical protein OAO18_02035 [Francisellaceae bacterium]|nr:hypothetical protein [Francisellaceae bacterium]
MSKVLFFHNNDLYKQHLNFDDSPECAKRLDIVNLAMQKCISENLIQPRKINVNINDPETCFQYIKKVHGQSHINSVFQSSKHISALNPIYGIVNTIDEVLNADKSNICAFYAVRPPGHHSFEGGANIEDDREGGIDCGDGYCYYNNVAIAAQYASERFNKKNILIIDWDYHHGNGTQHVFFDVSDIEKNQFTAKHSDKNIYFVSFHNANNYPYTDSGQENPVNFGTVKGKATIGNSYIDNVHTQQYQYLDEFFLPKFKQAMDQAFDNFQPDLVLISAGFDARKGDPIARFLPGEGISDKCYYDMTQILKKKVKQQKEIVPIISILEGGYNVTDTGFSEAVYEHIRGLVE